MSIKHEVLEILHREYPYLQERYGVKQLRLFGSVSREEDTDESDIDLLYIFSPEAANYDNLFELHEYLVNLFKRDVDLVSEEWSGERFLSSALENSVICCPKGSA